LASSSRHRWCTGVLAAVLLLWRTAPGMAAPPAEACSPPPPVRLQQDPQWIDQGVEVLFDAQRRYAVQEVAAGALCAGFRPLAGSPAFGVDPRGIWLRLRLPERAWASGDWRLLVPFAATDRFCAHWPLRAGGYRSECAHLGQPLGSGARARHGWYFRMPPDFDSTRALLLYTQGERVVEARLALGTADALVDYLYRRQTLLGAYSGWMLSLALFGLLMLVVQRERSYAYFSGYIIAGLLYFAAQGSYLSAFGDAGWLAVRLQWPLGALGALCMTLFFQSFLETRRYTPRLHRLALLCLLPYVALACSIPLLSPGLVVRLLMLLSAGWALALVSSMVARLVQGARAAAFGLLAFAVPTLGGVLKALEHDGLATLDPLVGELLICTGQSLAGGLLVIGLLGRMRRLACERDQAKDLALSSQQLALHRAHYDEVTHLPNRARFREELQAQLTQLAPGQRCALVILGLDRFGTLNDALGHEIGDSVLGEITQRLQQALGAHARLARIGADLFAWCTPLAAEAEGVEGLRHTCESLQQKTMAPLRVGSEARLTASCGIALYPDHAVQADRLLQYSDAALRRAKLRGAGSLQMFEPALHQHASRSLQLHRELYQALALGGLDLHYQPIVSLGNGRLLGVESLARWRRADGEWLPPEQFLPVAESSDLLRAFTEWGLRRFCTQLADWCRRDIAVPYASFNLSAAQLRLDGIGELILALLHETGAPASRMALEITEGSLLENLEATRSLLVRLKQEGMAVAVDDFGVGYASPHYLRMLPVDILKLDGVFLRGVPQDEQANVVLDSLIGLGHSLQLRIVSECLESEAQARYLAARGVSGGQGYFFSRALTAGALELWLQRRWVAAA